MDQKTITLTLIGMALVTYVPRLLPLWLLTPRAGRAQGEDTAEAAALPPLAIAWLRYVPAAVLAAMLLPALVVTEGRVDLSLGNLYLLAAFPTLLVAVRTRSLMAAVLVGMTVVAVVRLIL
jgi:branched-subunit amino acid transport protein